MSQQQLSLGRVVHYRLPDRYEGDERWRPAIVVQSFGACANLTVILDGANDGLTPEDRKALAGCACHAVGIGPKLLHPTSVGEGTSPGTFRWPPFVPPVSKPALPPEPISLEAVKARQAERRTTLPTEQRTPLEDATPPSPEQREARGPG